MATITRVKYRYFYWLYNVRRVSFTHNIITTTAVSVEKPVFSIVWSKIIQNNNNVASVFGKHKRVPMLVYTYTIYVYI